MRNFAQRQIAGSGFGETAPGYGWRGSDRGTLDGERHENHPQLLPRLGRADAAVLAAWEAAGHRAKPRRSWPRKPISRCCVRPDCLTGASRSRPQRSADRLEGRATRHRRRARRGRRPLRPEVRDKRRRVRSARAAAQPRDGARTRCRPPISRLISTPGDYAAGGGDEGAASRPQRDDVQRQRRGRGRDRAEALRPTRMI